MIRFIPMLAVLTLLGGCAQDFNSYTQDITFETPGTDGAVCYLSRPGFQQRVLAPKTVRITKSNEPLKVRCLAPGNREQTIILEPEGVDLGSVINGFVPGGLYSFPELVIVDFSYMQPRQMAQPDYQRVIEQNPDIVGMEEFRPGTPALQRDKHWVGQEIRERRSSTELFSGGNLTEIRTPSDAAQLGGGGQPVPLGKEPSDAPAAQETPAEIPAGADQTQTTPGGGFVGGTPVIGSEADTTGTLDDFGILAPGEQSLPVTIPEDQQGVHGPVILYPESE